MTATQTLGRYFGASQIIALGEIGYTYLDLPKGIDFNGALLLQQDNQTISIHAGDVSLRVQS